MIGIFFLVMKRCMIMDNAANAANAAGITTVAITNVSYWMCRARIHHFLVLYGPCLA
jgi:hypothetical protein